MNRAEVSPDAPSSNVAGQTTSITLFTTQRWWGRFFMPFMFATSRAVPKALEAMDSLSFISFASWSLIREIPTTAHRSTRAGCATRTCSSR